MEQDDTELVHLIVIYGVSGAYTSNKHKNALAEALHTQVDNLLTKLKGKRVLIVGDFNSVDHEHDRSSGVKLPYDNSKWALGKLVLGHEMIDLTEKASKYAPPMTYLEKSRIDRMYASTQMGCAQGEFAAGTSSKIGILSATHRTLACSFRNLLMKTPKSVSPEKQVAMFRTGLRTQRWKHSPATISRFKELFWKNPSISRKLDDIRKMELPEVDHEKDDDCTLKEKGDKYEKYFNEFNAMLCAAARLASERESKRTTVKAPNHNKDITLLKEIAEECTTALKIGLDGSTVELEEVASLLERKRSEIEAKTNLVEIGLEDPFPKFRSRGIHRSTTTNRASEGVKTKVERTRKWISEINSWVATVLVGNGLIWDSEKWCSKRSGRDVQYHRSETELFSEAKSAQAAEYHGTLLNGILTVGFDELATNVQVVQQGLGTTLWYSRLLMRATVEGLQQHKDAPVPPAGKLIPPLDPHDRVTPRSRYDFMNEYDRIIIAIGEIEELCNLVMGNPTKVLTSDEKQTMIKAFQAA
jgi:23S rRNA pseudoU1915 N3-methylase RlmH